MRSHTVGKAEPRLSHLEQERLRFIILGQLRQTHAFGCTVSIDFAVHSRTHPFGVNVRARAPFRVPAGLARSAVGCRIYVAGWRRVKAAGREQEAYACRNALVPQIRSSHDLAAPVSELRIWKDPSNVWVWFCFRSSLDGLAAKLKGTSEPPHWARGPHLEIR